MEGFKEIANKLSEEAILEQMIEESGELIQACAKKLRILRNENFTPISKEAIEIYRINSEKITKRCEGMMKNILNQNEEITSLKYEKLRLEPENEKLKNQLKEMNRQLKEAHGIEAEWIDNKLFWKKAK